MYQESHLLKMDIRDEHEISIAENDTERKTEPKCYERTLTEEDVKKLNEKVFVLLKTILESQKNDNKVHCLNSKNLDYCHNIKKTENDDFSTPENFIKWATYALDKDRHIGIDFNFLLEHYYDDMKDIITNIPGPFKNDIEENKEMIEYLNKMENFELFRHLRLNNYIDREGNFFEEREGKFFKEDRKLFKMWDILYGHIFPLSFIYEYKQNVGDMKWLTSIFYDPNTNYSIFWGLLFNSIIHHHDGLNGFNEFDMFRKKPLFTEEKMSRTEFHRKLYQTIKMYSVKAEDLHESNYCCIPVCYYPKVENRRIVCTEWSSVAHYKWSQFWNKLRDPKYGRKTINMLILVALGIYGLISLTVFMSKNDYRKVDSWKDYLKDRLQSLVVITAILLVSSLFFGTIKVLWRMYRVWIGFHENTHEEISERYKNGRTSFPFIFNCFNGLFKDCLGIVCCAILREPGPFEYPTILV